jgi:hypothetical protein
MNRLSNQNQVFHRLPTEIENQITINGEIQTFAGFSSEQIFLEYYLTMPPSYKLNKTQSEAKCSGRSQIVICEDDEHGYRGHLSFPLHWCFDNPANRTENSNVPLKIYFKVMGVDSWCRHRLEGYGSIEIPTEAGRHSIIVTTWKPELNFKSQLKQYFLGGGPELVDIRFDKIDKDTIFNRYGLRTMASGTVSFVFNITKQSHALVADEGELCLPGSEPLTTLDTRSALKRAKSRLKALKSFEMIKSKQSLNE